MTLVNKIIQVSSIHFYDTWLVSHCVPTTYSQIIFHHHIFGPLYHLLPSNYFPLATTILLSVYEFQFCILHVCKIIWFLTFSNISFSMMFSRSIHVVINGCISSFIYGQWYSIVCLYYANYMHTYSMYIYIYICVCIYIYHIFFM